MNNVPENELLSAYLDGELTAEEQAQVERLLAANPEARQLVDELRALSSSVKALPPHKIGRDISEEVLSRAKRGMPAQPMPARPGEQETPEGEAPLWRAVVRRVARPRNFVWSGVAVAVVVLLMVMKPETTTEPRARSVAMKWAADADEAAATASPPPSMQAVGEAEEALLEQEPAPAEMLVGGRPSGPVESAESEAEERQSPVAAARRAPSATTLSATPAAAPSAAIEQPAKAPTWPGRAADGYGRGFGGMPAGQAEVADDRGRPEAPGVAKRGAFKGQPSVTGKKAKAPQLGAAEESLPAKVGQRRRRGVQQPDVLLVVSCDVTAEALRGNAFKELLQRHEMRGVMTGAVAGGRTPGRLSGSEPIAPADEPDVRVVVGKPFEVVEVDVEATPDQIKALLADLRERPGQFSSLSYALDPAAVSRGLGRFWANGKASAQRQAGTALFQYQDVQTLDEPAAETLQQKVSRTDVDKVLDLARRFQYGRPLGEKAEAGATFGFGAPPARGPVQEEGQAGTAVPQPAMDRDHERAGPKLRASLAVPGAGEARPGAAGAYGAPMQSATPAESATPATGPFQAEMEQPTKAQAERLEMARPVRRLEAKQAQERRGAEAQQMPEREPTEAQPPALPGEGDRLDRDSGRYRVRFVLRVVRPQGGNVAASVAKDAPTIDMAGEAAKAAAAAPPAEMAPPQAPTAQAAEIER